MRKLWLAALLVVIALPVSTQASVITFGRNLPVRRHLLGSPGSGRLRQPQLRLGWQLLCLDGNIPYDWGYAYTYGAPSGAFAYNAFGDSPITLTSSVAFNFNGARTSAPGRRIISSRPSLRRRLRSRVITAPR